MQASRDPFGFPRALNREMPPEWYSVGAHFIDQGHCKDKLVAERYM